MEFYHKAVWKHQKRRLVPDSSRRWSHSELVSNAWMDIDIQALRLISVTAAFKLHFDSLPFSTRCIAVLTFLESYFAGVSRILTVPPPFPRPPAITYSLSDCTKWNSLQGYVRWDLKKKTAPTKILGTCAEIKNTSCVQIMTSGQKVRSPGQVKVGCAPWDRLQPSRSCCGDNFSRNAFKRSGWDIGVGTYRMHISDFSFQWSHVKLIFDTALSGNYSSAETFEPEVIDELNWVPKCLSRGPESNNTQMLT